MSATAHEALGKMESQRLRGTATDDNRVAVHSPMISQPLTKSCSSAAWPVHEVRRLEGFRPAHGADHSRLPAPIGYVPPVECEEQYYRRQEAPATLAGVT